jgi:hypothetical protein
MSISREFGSQLLIWGRRALESDTVTVTKCSASSAAKLVHS